jgi:biopolymer transport protein ExbB
MFDLFLTAGAAKASYGLMPASACVSKPGESKFGLVPALCEGGYLAQATAFLMLIMFLGTLYILFTKLFEQNKIMKQGQAISQSFWKAPTVREGAAKLDKDSAWRQIVDDAIVAEESHTKLSDPAEAHDWMHGAMERSQHHINSKLNGGLSFLATVGSTAPFVGLFGTVVGILNALVKIGSSGQASIDAVAGPVGEALIMTAAGLLVAVPAVMAYNWLQGRNKAISRQLSTFSNDVMGNLLSKGTIKPVIASSAAAPARAAAPAAAAKSA